MDVRRILLALCVAGGLAVGAVLPIAGPGVAIATSVPRPRASGPGIEVRVQVLPPSESAPPLSPSPVKTSTGGVLPVTGASGRGPLLAIVAGAGAVLVGVGLVLLVRRRRQAPVG